MVAKHTAAFTGVVAGTLAVLSVAAGCAPAARSDTPASATSSAAASSPAPSRSPAGSPASSSPASSSPAPGAGTPSRAAQAVPVGRADHRITVDGLGRTFHTYRPRTARPSWPVVVVLHGGFGDGGQAEKDYGWDALADREGVLVVYPDGVRRAWNTGGGCCGVPGRDGIDDVSFVEAVVAQVSAALPVDRRRVYVTGISNGGMLAYRIACDSTVFAAVGPVAATLLGPCRKPARISVVHVHGTADGAIPYDGSQGGGVAKIDGPPVPDVVASWRRVDGCARPRVTTSGVVTTSTATCPSGRAVTLVTIDGAGHQWPGGRNRPGVQRLLGTDPPSDALDATATIWRFFATHPKP